MSNSIRRHAAVAFAADVLQPIAERASAAAVEGAHWREQWAVYEAAESLRMLHLGRVLGAFDVDLSTKIEDVFGGLFRRTHTLGDLGDTNRFLRVTDEALREVMSQHTRLWVDDSHDWARARGLFQVNSLISSRMGHALAAEAIALLTFGNESQCLERLEKLAHRRYTRTEETLLVRFMSDPGEDASEAVRLAPDVAMAASVYHAAQYMWSLAFTHEERQHQRTARGYGFDPMLPQMGELTGDLVHRFQYWRLNFRDERFESLFLGALKLAATCIFRMDVTKRTSGIEDAEVFADELCQRAKRVSKAWRMAFGNFGVETDQSRLEQEREPLGKWLDSSTSI